MILDPQITAGALAVYAFIAAHAPDAVTIKQVAERFSISEPTVHNARRTLEALKLIECINADLYSSDPLAMRLPAEQKKLLSKIDQEVIADVWKVFTHWRATMKKPKRTPCDSKRTRLIHKALKSYGVQGCLAAIDGCALTPHNMGVKDDGSLGTLYNGLELIFRSADQVERFIETAERAKTKKQTAAKRERQPKTPPNLDCPICLKYRRLNGTEKPFDQCSDCWE